MPIAVYRSQVWLRIQTVTYVRSDHCRAPAWLRSRVSYYKEWEGYYVACKTGSLHKFLSTRLCTRQGQAKLRRGLKTLTSQSCGGSCWRRALMRSRVWTASETASSEWEPKCGDTWKNRQKNRGATIPSASWRVECTTVPPGKDFTRQEGQTESGLLLKD